MTETTQEKEHDVLDDIKLAEKQMKMAILMKNLKSLKEFAKEVLIQKEKMLAALEEMGMTETEQKRVIDFINNLVQLTKREKEEIRDEARETNEQTQEKIEKKIADDPLALLKQFGGYAGTAGSLGQQNAGPYYAGINNATYKAENGDVYSLLSKGSTLQCLATNTMGATASLTL